MTKPTQAQIEAAAAAMHRYDVEHGLNLDGLASPENYLPIAKAALTAAAQVGDDKVVDGYGYGWRASFESSIERCAQVVKQWLDAGAISFDAADSLISAIRKLKDAP